MEAMNPLTLGYASSACRRFGNGVARRQSLMKIPVSSGGWLKFRKHSFAQSARVPLIVGSHGQNGLSGIGPWSAPSWSSRPRSPSLESGITLVCKVAVEEGASDQKVAEQTVDGSVLTGDGSELQNTVRLVECAMLAATAGLAYFLSNLFRLEGYLGCFFPLPVVISSMRWGASAGRKTMIATALLLLVLSGPLRSASYLLMHGFVGLAIGALWRWHVNWLASLLICTVVRCFGALGFVLLSSWLLRENLLALITINAYASVTYMLAALGINFIPTMMLIYFVFGGLLFLNCGSFVFLLHVLYVIFLKRLGIETKIAVPGWIARAV
ncbi:unnamed protein product [Calypogeia fissa]